MYLPFDLCQVTGDEVILAAVLQLGLFTEAALRSVGAAILQDAALFGCRKILLLLDEYGGL